MRSPRRLNSALVMTSLLCSPALAAAQDLAVTDEQIRRMEIKVEPVKPAVTEPIALLPGTVVPPMNSRLTAVAPFAGTVVQVHVLPGQRVSKGMDLITLSSRELLEAKSQLAQSEAELQMAEAIARRKRILVDKNFQSAPVAEEAEAQVAKIRAVIEQHKRTTAMNNIRVVANGSYTVPAPADGIVVESRAMPGDTLTAMAAAVTLDTSDELWVEAQVPSSLVAQMKPGDKVQVAGGPEGRIVALGATLDKLTRSAELTASFPAKSGLIAGQMVTISVLRSTAGTGLTVPLNAVARIENKNAVFVRNGTGFTLVPVELRGTSPDGATISGAIQADAQVAASGLPQLEQMLTAE